MTASTRALVLRTFTSTFTSPWLDGPEAIVPSPPFPLPAPLPLQNVVTPQVKQAFGHLRRFAVIHSRLPSWASAEERAQQLAAAQGELLSYARLAETVRACRLVASASLHLPPCVHVALSLQPAPAANRLERDLHSRAHPCSLAFPRLERRRYLLQPSRRWAPPRRLFASNDTQPSTHPRTTHLRRS